MPWRKTCPMDQRREFIDGWLHDEGTFADLCARFAVSRKTGYKWVERFEAGGAGALVDRSRARLRQETTSAERVARIIALRQRHPFWGPKKLKSRLERLEPAIRWPAGSTIGEILRRHGLVVARRTRRRTPIYEGPFVVRLAPNDVWAADFKGWFRTTDGTRVDPLTVSDGASRFLIRCRAVAKTDGDNVQAQLTSAFQEFGLPKALRTDNGVPFATVGVGGLSRLGVWLIKLGVTPERIRPAHPEENGAHERMHRTLKQQTAKPPRTTLAEQQEAFDRFKAEYNGERPHEALGMKTPGEVYRPSPRPFPRRLSAIEYPAGSVVRRVSTNGTVKFKDKGIYVSNALVDEDVRLEENETGWQVSYGPVLLGALDLEKELVKRLPTKVLPMCPV